MNRLGRKGSIYDARRVLTLSRPSARGAAQGGFDADTVDGYHASNNPTAAMLLALNSNGQFDSAVWQLGNGLNTSGSNVQVRLATLSGLTFSSCGLCLADTVAASGLTITDKTLSVGAGDGIDVTADAIAVDVTDFLGTGMGETSNNLWCYQVLNSGGSGSALRADASGYIEAISRLGIGVSPGRTFQLRGTAGPQVRLEYDASNYVDMTISSGGNLTVAPTGDFIFDPTGNDILPNTGYDLNIGSLSKKYLTLHCAELWVETLVAQNTIATIGGRILVGPTTTLEVDLGSGDATITIAHNQMTRQDIGYMEADGKVEFLRPDSYAITGVSTDDDYFTMTGDKTADFEATMKFTIVESSANNGEWTVASAEFEEPVTKVYVDEEVADSGDEHGYILYTGTQGTGPFVYLNVTRNLDGTGANDWYAGDAVFNTGQTGDGFIDLYSLQGVNNSSSEGPTIVMNVRNSATWNDWDEHAAFGNLDGTYGYGATTYGIALGEYASGKPWVAVDSTNGVRIMNYTTQLGQWDTSGNILIGQTAAGQSNVYITSGSVQLRTATTAKVVLGTAGTILVGETGAGQSNVFVTSGCLQLRNNVTSAIVLDASGNVLVGQTAAGQSNVYITSGCVLLRNATTEIVGLYSGSVSSGAYARFSKPLELGAAGGIFQGTGTFASPCTALKIWNDTGIGRIAGYSSTSPQWYAGTDGKMYAGGGAVALDSDGIAITTTTTWDQKRSYQFLTSGSLASALEAYKDASVNYLRLRSEDFTGLDTYMLLTTEAPSGRTSLIFLSANIAGGNEGKFYIYPTYLYTNVEMRILDGLTVGDSTTSPSAGQIQIKQDNAAGAIIPLVIDQQDVDQPYIKFASGTIYTGKTAQDEYVMVEDKNGNTRYLRLYS